jgi:ABC-type bacteriocin/lantibiotic exporter with double-glycine peptidase domain
MLESVFIALVLTVVTVLFMLSHSPELCAVGIVFAVLAFYAWCGVLSRLDKTYDKH